MKIILAGHNLDFETIREFQELRPEARNLTPETISAAYARISRSPKPVDALRSIARQEIEKARQSNETGEKIKSRAAGKRRKAAYAHA